MCFLIIAKLCAKYERFISAQARLCFKKISPVRKKFLRVNYNAVRFFSQCFDVIKSSRGFAPNPTNFFEKKVRQKTNIKKIRAHKREFFSLNFFEKGVRGKNFFYKKSFSPEKKIVFCNLRKLSAKITASSRNFYTNAILILNTAVNL